MPDFFFFLQKTEWIGRTGDCYKRKFLSKIICVPYLGCLAWMGIILLFSNSLLVKEMLNNTSNELLSIIFY